MTSFKELYNIHSNKIVSHAKKFKGNVDSQIDKNFENFIFCFKIIIIILFLIWFGVLIAKCVYDFKLKKNNDQYNINKLVKTTKILNIINDINYYLILIFTFILIFVMLFKLYPFAHVVIQHVKEHVSYIVKKATNIKTEKPLHNEKALVPTQILSVTWWLLVYFVFIIIIIVVDKATKTEKAAYYL